MFLPFALNGFYIWQMMGEGGGGGKNMSPRLFALERDHEYLLRECWYGTWNPILERILLEKMVEITWRCGCLYVLLLEQPQQTHLLLLRQSSFLGPHMEKF